MFPPLLIVIGNFVKAGIAIELKAILSFEYLPSPEGGAKQRMIFYAHPKYLDAPLKCTPDFESLRAIWVTFDELDKAIQNREVHLRGNEPYKWFLCIEKGGKMHDLSILNEK